MNRGRLDRFDACRDCFFWKVKKFLSERKENLMRFMKCEVDMEYEEERKLVRGMMQLSQESLAPLIEKEYDIYKKEDLKVRFR